MSSSSSSSPSGPLQELTTSFSKLQSQYTTLIEARQRLDSQLGENLQVQKEFKGLKEGNQVYKLIGPVLMKVEQVEARGNVDKRIEFIKGEIKRVEQQIAEVGGQTESKRMQIIKLQQEQQRTAAGVAA